MEQSKPESLNLSTSEILDVELRFLSELYGEIAAELCDPDLSTIDAVRWALDRLVLEVVDLERQVSGLTTGVDVIDSPAPEKIPETTLAGLLTLLPEHLNGFALRIREQRLDLLRSLVMRTLRGESDRASEASVLLDEVDATEF